MANMGMLTEQDIAELLDIRRKMDALQARYGEIMRKAGGAPPLAAVESKPAPSTAPSAQPPPPQPPSQPQPQPQPSPPAQSRVSPPTSSLSSVRPSQVPAAEKGPRATSSIQTDKGPLVDAIRNVLVKSGRPMGFEDIFAKLEAEKAPLPDDRPKLAVRKVLYNKSLFSVKNSFYTLVEDAAPPPEESPAPAAPPPAPSQTTATRGNFLKDKLQAILGE